MKVRIKAPKSKIFGAINLDGDKSITHRSIIISSIAKGKSKVANYLDGEDCNRTIEIMRDLGVEINKSENELEINGLGLTGLVEPDNVLYAGNSGTTMRLTAGLLSGQQFLSVISGDKSLSSRPMDRIIDPLNSCGANILGKKNNKRAPIVIAPGSLKPFNYSSKIASAQVKSAMLFSALYNKERSVYQEIYPSRDHTERMLKFYGADIELSNQKIIVSGKNELIAQEMDIPGDFSTAAFFIALAALIEDSELLINNVNLNPYRIGFLKALSKMGLKYEILNKQTIAEEPVADIKVYGSKLRSIVVKPEEIPSMIDEVPLLALVASKAKGKTRIEGVRELIYKESNRLNAINQLLHKIGIKSTIDSNSITIEGNQVQRSIEKVDFEHFNDHRMAMTIAIIACIYNKETVIENAEVVNISAPSFFDNLAKFAKVEVV
jgi:3-phosphoshikimate 1-carboxyvinyltransferase